MRVRFPLIAAAAAAVALVLPTADAFAGSKPSLTPSVQRVDCGNQAVDAGAKACGSVTFTNTASRSVQLVSQGIQERNAVDFLMGNSCTVPTMLAPGDSCVVSVSFNPVASGRRSAKLTLYEGTLKTTSSVSLVGRGT